MIRILQISDIHWKKRKHWDEDFPGMKKRFLVDIEEYVKAKGAFDLIFICGDVAFQGAKDEYDEAKNYILDICKAVGCSEEQVFVVPGNHDLNRKAEGANIRELVNTAISYEQRNKELFEETVLKTSNLKNSVYRAFEHYYDFSTRYFCQEEVMGKCLKSAGDDIIYDEDKLYYEENNAKKLDDIDVYIRGVNTALNCDEWDRDEENTKGHPQFLPKRAYILDNINKQEVRILLAHHPLEFLSNKDEVEQYLNSYYHIQFFGHVHEQHIHEQNKADGNFVRVYSGAFDPPKDNQAPNKYKPIYNIVELVKIDDGHIKVRGESQRWEENKFLRYNEGCFEKTVEIEQKRNKWENSMTGTKQIDARSIKFKFIRRDDRLSFFDKIEGLDFEPKEGRSENDKCLDFLAEVEKNGKLAELNDIMK